MTGLEVIEDKISTIQQALRILRGYTDTTVEELKTDFKIRGVVERYLYIATQATIDLAETIIAYKNLRKPREYKEAFEILNEANLLHSQLAQKLADMVGFRNSLAHAYDRVNYQIVVDALRNGVKDIEEFLTVVKQIS